MYEFSDLKWQERKLEHKHKSLELTIDLEIYREARAAYEKCKDQVTRDYYNNKVLGCMDAHMVRCFQSSTDCSIGHQPPLYQLVTLPLSWLRTLLIF